MQEISWNDFAKVELRAGTVTRVEPFPEARRPAWKVWADFGPELGELKASAQITALYQPRDLIGRQIIGVVNFPSKQIGPFTSQFLLTGFHSNPDGTGPVVISGPERPVPNGAKLC
ncbi:MAG: tRNA-binding protein [Deltaproteobacteria bacterium]|jgi:tRNA-binding protein|nr:tRNA-binding protein [Deltaproteobacteria bacterium]